MSSAGTRGRGFDHNLDVEAVTQRERGRCSEFAHLLGAKAGEQQDAVDAMAGGFK